MHIHLDHRWTVTCRATLHLPLPARVAWGELRDFVRHSSHDTFHAGIQIDGGTPRCGARLCLRHRYLCFRVIRTGRILRWREWQPARTSDGVRSRRTLAGYSFSDLSLRGPHHGFPHVLSYYLTEADAHQCRLTVVVRGRWTARAMPRWMAALWLRWVFAHVVIRLRNSMLLRGARGA